MLGQNFILGPDIAHTADRVDHMAHDRSGLFILRVSFRFGPWRCDEHLTVVQILVNALSDKGHKGV